MCLECVQKMNNLKCRKQGFNKIICKRTNKEIKFSECNNCPYKEYKEVKKTPIKKRSSSLQKLERDRYSILTDNMEKCILCPKKAVNKHEVFFGTGQRKLSMKYGLVIPLCYQCHINMHHNSTQQLIWHIKGQTAFEKEYPDLNFLEIFKEKYK